MRLGQDGYAFAEIRAVPELDEETKQASITFFVDPRNRVYVRRINFNGADNVNDEVFRREMRQLEGGYLVEQLGRALEAVAAAAAVRRSRSSTRRRRCRAARISSTSISRSRRGCRGSSAAASASPRRSASRSAAISSTRISWARGAASRSSLRGGEYQKVYDINFTDPYRNIDGVARTISFTYQDITQFTSVTSDFSTTTLSAGMNWSYPIANFQRLTFGFAYQDAELLDEQLQLATGARVGAEQRRIVRGRRTAFLGTEGQELGSRHWLGSTTRAMPRCFRRPARACRWASTRPFPAATSSTTSRALDFTKYIPLPGKWLFQDQ